MTEARGDEGKINESLPKRGSKKVSVFFSQMNELFRVCVGVILKENKNAKTAM